MEDQDSKVDATSVTPPVQTGLTIQDLLLVIQVIQVATTRGAFKAEELTPIGNLYDRLYKFLDASGAIPKAAPEPAATAPEVTAVSSKVKPTKRPTKKSKEN